jgi:hypothetical protein
MRYVAAVLEIHIEEQSGIRVWIPYRPCTRRNQNRYGQNHPFVKSTLHSYVLLAKTKNRLDIQLRFRNNPNFNLKHLTSDQKTPVSLLLLLRFYSTNVRFNFQKSIDQHIGPLKIPQGHTLFIEYGPEFLSLNNLPLFFVASNGQ